MNGFAERSKLACFIRASQQIRVDGSTRKLWHENPALGQLFSELRQALSRDPRPGQMQVLEFAELNQHRD